jgi:aminoglycoside 6'-N-acetyltransferase I
MTIEKLSATSLHAITQLALELWPGRHFEEEYACFKKIVRSASEACYLARQEDQFIGFIHVSTRRDYVEGADALPIAYLEAVYIQPAYRKKGVSPKLVGAAGDWARQNGFAQIASDMGLSNKASIRFHQKIGFTEAERIVCFIKNL